jgi:hypothetical protein
MQAKLFISLYVYLLRCPLSSSDIHSPFFDDGARHLHRLTIRRIAEAEHLAVTIVFEDCYPLLYPSIRLWTSNVMFYLVVFHGTAIIFI